MPFSSELLSHQYGVVRSKSYKSAQYISLCPNEVVFQASVNQTVFPTSFAAITYDNVTIGAYTDILVGQTVLVGPTDDIRDARFVGRVRANNSGVVATTTLVGINETSAQIENNWIITVIDDYRMYHELGRVSGGVYYKDYGITFKQLRPLIYNLQSGYAGWVSGSPSGFTIAFNAVAIAATSGATISSYQWTTPDGTVTSGSLSSATVTIRFPAGFRWVKLVVTDSGSRTQTRYIPIWAHSMDYLPAMGFTGATITGDEDNGYSATVEAFSGVDDVADNTLVCIWNREYYDDVETSFVSTVEFVGRFRRENGEQASDEVYSLIDKTTFEIEGPTAQLSRISGPTITMRDAGSPDEWDEIKNLTPWRAVAYILEHSTFHQLYSLRFDSTTNAYRAFELEAAQGNLLNSVQDIASSITAKLEWSPQGDARMVREGVFLDDDDRNALPMIADFEPVDFIRILPEREHVESVGLVEGDGGTYAPTAGGIATNAVVPKLSIAPGVAQGNAEGTSQLTRQILLADVSETAAQAELNERLGNKLAKDNLMDTLSVDMDGRYHWMVPSVAQWYTWTFVYRGLVYDTSIRWWLKSISITHDNDLGAKTVNATFVRETQGGPGQTQDYPAQGSVEPVVPTIPVTQPYPNAPMLPDIVLPDTPSLGDLPPGWGLTPPATVADPVPLNGSGTMTFNSQELWITRLFLSVPIWVNRTPDGMEGTIRDAKMVGKTCYLLTSDGTDSWFYCNQDVFAGNTWSDATELEGEYGLIQTTSTAGAVYVQGLISEGGEEGPWEYEFDFTEASGEFTAIEVDYGGSVFGTGRWTDGSGWEGQIPGSTYKSRLLISRSFTETTITSLEVGYTNPATVDFGDLASILDLVVFLYDESDDLLYDTGNMIAVSPANPGSAVAGSGTIDIEGVARMEIRLRIQAIGPSPGWGGLIISLHLTGTNTFPFAGGIVTRYTDDDGATFGEEEILSADGLGGGMDTLKIGAVALAGTIGQVKKATSGGTWADYGDPLPDGFNPICLVIPRYQFGSTSSGNTSSSPQYLVASSVEDDDGETMYKVTSSGTVFTAITPEVSGDKGLAVGPCCVWMPWWSGSIIAAILQFGSLPRLVISTNGGTSWTDRGVVNEDALMGVFRRGDKTMQQLFLANAQPAYSKNRGASIVSKTYPADYITDPVLGIQVYG